MNAIDLQHLARVIAPTAYFAYGIKTGGKNYQGLPMPDWKELPEKIQNAWYAATHATIEQFMILLESPLPDFIDTLDNLKDSQP
jgi:hypothetical protein